MSLPIYIDGHVYLNIEGYDRCYELVKKLTPDEMILICNNLAYVHPDFQKAFKDYWIPDWDKTAAGYSFFQFNKIRMQLTKIFTGNGYPIRYHHSMDYFSGVSVWIPVEVDVNQFYSSLLWESKDNAISIKYKGSYERIKHYYDIAEIKRNVIWRYVVCTKKIDMDSPFAVIKKIPIFGGLISELYEDFTAFLYPIFGNLSFYNTINNILIARNWDIIRHVLMNNR